MEHLEQIRFYFKHYPKGTHITPEMREEFAESLLPTRQKKYKSEIENIKLLSRIASLCRYTGITCWCIGAYTIYKSQNP
jgi:hypothetical protein